MVMPDSVADRHSRQELFLMGVVIWSMCLITFTLPGRQSGGLDIVALAKLAVRGGTLVVFLYVWCSNSDLVAKRRVGWFYFPFLCFLSWAFVSASWSPLKVVSVGQAIGLASLLALSAWVALVCRDSRNIVFATKQLWLALLAFSLLMLLFHAVRPDLSGLSRSNHLRGANGIMHPTYAAATAGLSFVLTLLCPKLLKGFELGSSLLPALVVHGLLLYCANSRTALALTALVSMTSFLWLYSKRVHSLFLMTSAGVACIYLVFDSGFELHKESLQSSTAYITRGQSQQQLSRLSGRVEMWNAVLEQFEKSPLIGHGYFVTSENGRLDVWDGPSNHTAHNLVLQVLVSTGVIGGIVFFVAFWRIGSAVWRLRWGDSSAKCTFVLLLLIGLWYLGWCQTCISFIGPVLPESVVFFLLLGLGVGQAVRLQHTTSPNDSSIASS